MRFSCWSAFFLVKKLQLVSSLTLIRFFIKNKKMNYKIVAAIVFFLGFSISIEAQKTIGSVETAVEQIAAQQRAAEKADPTLSKTRPGRIATKEEKVAIQKNRKAEHQKMAKALKSIKNKKMKVSKAKHPQPTKGTSKKIKRKEE